MKTYLVGGCVRDHLLKMPVTDRDWVVVGSTSEKMLDCGFRPVGKSFPVFLHPKTNEEYALARTEIKTAPGYKGFAVHADQYVTLEQDLMRRDLTINAIAMDEGGTIIDPCGGLSDLQNKKLRHISAEAFVEDPVRLLRVARLAARYEKLGFTIATETMILLRQIVSQGEINHLVPDRVWTETVKALAEASPQVYFKVLRDCGALALIFPEIDCLFGIPQTAEHHPEVDTGLHVLLTLVQAARLSHSPVVRFAALTHDLGKGLTNSEILPAHHGHEKAGVPLLESLCRRLRVPNEYRKLATHVMIYHTHCHQAFTLRPGTLVDLLNALDAYHHPDLLEEFLIACEADARGRTGFEHRHYLQAAFIRSAWQITAAIGVKQVNSAKLRGQNIALAIREKRIHAIKTLKQESRWNNMAK